MATEQEWTCLRKHRYRTRKKAIVVAQRSQRDFGRMKAYRCPFGQPRHYHVGHPRRVNPPGVDSSAMSDVG